MTAIIHNPLDFTGVTCSQAKATFPEIYEGKETIVNSINARGGAVSITDSYATLSSAIESLVTPTIEVTPIQNYPACFHDLFQIMADNYDASYPYMYAILLTRDTTSAVMALLNDGTTRAFGGESDSGKVTRWAVFRSATAGGFSFVYNSTYVKYLMGIAVYNANIQGLSFYGSKPFFIYWNTDYYLENLVFAVSQFQNTNINTLIIPACGALTFSTNSFNTTIISNLFFTGTTITISGISVFYTSPNLMTVSFSNTVTSIIISGNSCFQLCPNLASFILPENLETLTITGTYFIATCTSITQFIIPNSVTSLNLGTYTFFQCSVINYIYIPMPSISFIIGSAISLFGSCPLLVKIELGTNWDYSFNMSSALALTKSNIVDFIFTKLKDNVGLTAKTITLSSRYNTGGADPLTAEQKLVATSRNWTIAYA